MTPPAIAPTLLPFAWLFVDEVEEGEGISEGDSVGIKVVGAVGRD